MPKKKDEKIANLKSLAAFDAANEKKGDVTQLNFDGEVVRRTVHNGEAVYSVVDVVGILAESKSPAIYWRSLKKRLLQDEGASQAVANCNALKLPTEGGRQVTDCANIETLLRIIQSVPSKKAEPFKQWLAQVGYERIEETVEPSRAMKRAVQAYRDLGRPSDWIDNRMQNVSAETELREEWDDRRVPEQSRPVIENAMHKQTHGITPDEHRTLKRLHNPENPLADHMTTLELAFDTLGKAAAKEIIVQRDTKNLRDTKRASVDGAKVAGKARQDLETTLGRPVVSGENFLPKHIKP